MITWRDVRLPKGESCRGRRCREVVGGSAFDVALFASDESLRSLASPKVVAVIGVVLCGVRWLPIEANLKTRRSGDFYFTETAV